nr:hypothetical protein B0A51_13575 [Rachicladosporium sp. CCFEE 5018]OQO24091.1 hypothetical protein B0A51_05934 [Rachicladosporium sp. CCFEE 5018]
MPRYTLETLKKPDLYLEVAILPDGTVHAYVGSSFAAARVKQRVIDAYDRPLTYAKAGRWSWGFGAHGFARCTANMVAKEYASVHVRPLMIFEHAGDAKGTLLLSQELHFYESSFIMFMKTVTDEKRPA